METDRYVSFLGLDCSGRAERFAGDLRTLMRETHREEPFWTYLVGKLDGSAGPVHDALYHIHCHLNDIRDLLDRIDAPDLAAQLEIIETECC
jgi:hypothetical protein